MATSPLALVVELAAYFDAHDLPYAIGGSVASSAFGEPRTTVDVDVAVYLDEESGEALLRHVDERFYVPLDSAREAIRTRSSFNLLDRESSMKVDIFVLGDGLLDRRQIGRRIKLALPDAPDGIWFTAPEDQILRKLDWYRKGGEVSDRQWRDVLGILRTLEGRLDLDDLHATALEVGLDALLARAQRDAVL